jgi:hypothetical protein
MITNNKTNTMKSIRFSTIVTAVWLILIGLTFAQCEKEDVNEKPEAVLQVDNLGYSNMNQQNLRRWMNYFPKESLSDVEIAGLMFMREEEKLAHDVYTKFYDVWNSQIFGNIANSEQTHADAVLSLIEKYNLIDPVGNSGEGIFQNTDLQKLYTDLVNDGLNSLEDALKVGAAIEEIDILDLETQLESRVDNQDITYVYENLLKGSRNHLRAFVKNMNTLGINYQPQYLSTAEYNEIISGAIENGRN